MAAKGSVPCDHPSWGAWSSYWLCSWPPDPTPGRQTLSLLRAYGHHVPAYSWSKPGGVSAPTSAAAEQRQWQDMTVGTSVPDPGNILASSRSSGLLKRKKRDV